MLMKCYSRDKILNLIMLVSFVNFSRAFKIISIESPEPKHIKGKRMHPGEKEYIYFFFFSPLLAYTQFNKPDGINVHRSLIYNLVLEGQKIYKHTVRGASLASDFFHSIYSCSFQSLINYFFRIFNIL